MLMLSSVLSTEYRIDTKAEIFTQRKRAASSLRSLIAVRSILGRSNSDSPEGGLAPA
jgi:hypothetical protein